jgi:hypothetical protein
MVTTLSHLLRSSRFFGIRYNSLQFTLYNMRHVELKKKLPPRKNFNKKKRIYFLPHSVLGFSPSDTYTLTTKVYSNSWVRFFDQTLNQRNPDPPLDSPPPLIKTITFEIVNTWKHSEERVIWPKNANSSKEGARWRGGRGLATCWAQSQIVARPNLRRHCSPSGRNFLV